MMKKHFLLFALLASLTLSAADDVIILKNSTRVDAKIAEITDSELRYTKANNTEGPVYTTKLSDVSIVILANGEVISYADYKQPAASSKPLAKKDKGAVQSKDTTAKSCSMKFNPEPSDKRTFGLSLGYASRQVSSPSLSYKSGYLGEDKSYEPNFDLGMIVQPEFKYGIGIKTGLNFEIGHEKVGDGKLQVQSIDLNLSIPLQVSYRYELIKNLSVFIYTGPVFDFGVYMAISEGAAPYSECENLYSNGLFKEYGYSGFNCLWGIGAGVQYSGLRLTMGGDFGMVNKSESSVYPMKLNRPFMISLAYMFNNKTKN